MNTDFHSRAPFRYLTHESRHGASVQDRPTLGNLPRARRVQGWWLAPAIDLAAAFLALALVAIATGDRMLPALPFAPLLFLALNGALGVYANRAGSSLGGEVAAGGPVMRLLTAALFAWSTSLLTPLDPVAQLILWLAVVALGSVGRVIWAPLLRRQNRVERWILIGDDRTAERLRAYAPLRQQVSIVAVVAPAEDRVNAVDRVAALGSWSIATGPTEW